MKKLDFSPVRETKKTVGVSTEQKGFLYTVFFQNYCSNSKADECLLFFKETFGMKLLHWH